MFPSHEIINCNKVHPLKIFSFITTDTQRIIPIHWHEHSELLFCISGHINVNINSSNYLLSPKDAIIINPYSLHSTYCPTKAHILCLQFPLEYLQELTENHFYNDYIFSLNTVTSDSLSPKNLKILFNISSECSYSKLSQVSHNIKLRGLAELLLSNLLEYNISNLNLYSKKDITHSFAYQFIDYIATHYRENISLSSTAQDFNYSPSYLSKRIKATICINFKDYLNSVRLNAAYTLIKTTNKSIHEIAIESGFSNYRNFYNIFKHNYNFSPIFLRRKI